MKLSIKVVGIVGVVLLVTVLLIVFSDAKEPDPEKGKPADKQNHLFSSASDFDEIHLLNNAKSQEIKLTKNEQGGWVADQLEKKPDQDKIDRTVALIFSLSSSLEKTDTSLKDSGIEETQKSIELIDDAGLEKTLNIGGKSEDGSVYYASFLDSEDIYQVNGEVIDQLPTSIQDLYDKSIVQVTPEDVNKITIKNGIQIIELTPESSFSEEEARTNLSGWYMHQPYKNVYSINYNQMSDMIYGINNLEWEEIIAKNGGNLADYGLENVDFEITLRSDSGENTILIGATASGQSYYAKLKNDDKVFTIEKSFLHPYSYQAFDLVEKFVKIVAVDVVKQLIIQDHDHEINITIDHEEVKNSEAKSESKINVNINGEQMEESTFRSLYKVIAGLTVSEEINDATYETPEATMTYTILDNSTGEKEVKVEFVPYNKQNFAVFLNGKADFLVKKNDYFKMIDEITKQS